MLRNPNLRLGRNIRVDIDASIRAPCSVVFDIIIYLISDLNERGDPKAILDGSLLVPIIITVKLIAYNMFATVTQVMFGSSRPFGARRCGPEVHGFRVLAEVFCQKHGRCLEKRILLPP
jgi:hypothetical protein